MRTAIVGLGVTGMSCIRHLADADELVVFDSRPQPPGLAEAKANFPALDYRLATEAFDGRGFDRAILSPGIAPRSLLARRVAESGLPTVTDIDLFFAAAREPVYTVTGTNGKSTVTALIGHLLAASGARPGVGGNLGLAALDAIAPDRDCYVLELSSFQLARSRTDARCRAATILNLSGDHLDWHGTMGCYAAAKQRVYTGARRVVANRLDAATYPAKAQAHELTTFGDDAPAAGHWGIRNDGRRALACGKRRLVDTQRLPLAGRHNEQNVLAALAMVHGAEFRDEAAALEAALAGFRGLPHRCETVAVVDGTTYINDSKATNIGAAIAALRSFADASGELVLIAGGVGKGGDFAPFGDAVAAAAKHLVVMGVDGPAIAEAVRGRVPLSRAGSLPEAVRQAAAAARPGDRVLLSPACASFDQFDDFSARGVAFVEAVAEMRR